MSKIIIHAFTKDKNNPHLPIDQELFKTVCDSLGGFVAWIDLVDKTNKTTYEHADKVEEDNE